MKDRKVLIVDDNEDTAELLAITLQRLGYTTRTAHDGPAALTALQTFRPDLALLDIGLPGMDGYELARQMRQIPAIATPRLVAITGYGQESDRQRAHDAGFDAHLVKPVSLAKLRAVLDAPS
ncbi:MAG: response regulator [Kofleriaceae bacterium]